MASHHLPALGNAAPFHLLTQASVEELNRKIPDLKTPITALNFRLTNNYIFGYLRSCNFIYLFPFQTKYCGKDPES